MAARPEVLARYARHHRLAAELAVRADLACHTSDFRRKTSQLIDHRVDGIFELENLAFDIDGDLLRQIAIGDGDRHLGDISHLSG